MVEKPEKTEKEGENPKRVKAHWTFGFQAAFPRIR